MLLLCAWPAGSAQTLCQNALPEAPAVERAGCLLMRVADNRGMEVGGHAWLVVGCCLVWRYKHAHVPQACTRAFRVPRPRARVAAGIGRGHACHRAPQLFQLHSGEGRSCTYARACCPLCRARPSAWLLWAEDTQEASQAALACQRWR